LIGETFVWAVFVPNKAPILALFLGIGFGGSGYFFSSFRF
jgi:hypothetical protein